ncbi:hypothetical protein MBM_01218 [Drepanopeziza brunnea f. sp. 'multigermtubi' MB_m1]|uniref:DUF1740-domain-containing protein n=1 Tax=Marssonina brunnea f. sp. multigermtubi (strain MB_m1) TaxID=1072389 RepID=K1X5X5_MARBU|nr:uncharacterized protein MBM_01218 [Drepanopeziza brunnea f. sp. 'multigermtubi' MB_m1]EKD20536.1 hypothetical protein MBM_01218 [Drepanopeziza brunnea f. sp. 'multigermtubi' MB_m1]
MSASNVPKFASFRPKPVPTNSEPDEAKSKPRAEARHRSRGCDEKEEGKRHHRRYRSRERTRPSVQAIEKAPVSRVSPEPGSPEVFIVDRKGDVNNLVYGSVHRWTVPPFYRYGSGYVLGASLDLKIDRNFVEDKGVVLSNFGDSKPSSREKYVFSRVEREKPRLLKIRPEATVADPVALESDFVPLQARRGKKRKRGEDVGSSSDEEKRDYRSIHSKKKDNTQPLDEDLRYATESDCSDSDAGRIIKEDDSLRQKNVELSRKVEECPLDIEAWLALIEHQDLLMTAGDNGRRVTTAEIKSTADIKIHMYEKALENSRSLEDRERLLLGLMAEGAKIWEVKTQADRWERISRENIDSLFLWTSYLNFKQTNFSTFRYDEVKGVLLDRIKVLKNVVESTAEDAGATTLYEQLLYVVLRSTLFMRESGYTELAISIWEGLLEMNFNSPQQQVVKPKLTDSFKDFWESEVARIGEDGSLGWDHFFASSGDDVEVPNTLVDETNDPLDNSNIFQTWVTAERIRMKCSQIPARTMDEVVEDDPYRVIMFSDIEDFMLQLPPQSEELRQLCIDAFLLFCRLPPMTTVDSDVSRKWSNDAFIRDELLECSPTWIKKEYFTTRHNESDDVGTPSFLRTSFPNCFGSSELLFGSGLAGNYYFGAPNMTTESAPACPLQARYEGNNSPVSQVWISNVLKQLIQARFTEDLAEYYLAFEFHISPSTIKKISKGLLKQHPSSLRLYNAYAMIEWARGNKDLANTVFTASISTSTSISTSSILLWRNWVWLHILSSSHTSALHLLLDIPSGTPNPKTTLTPALLLKTRQHLLSTRDYLTSTLAYPLAALYTDCLALLAYLTSPPTSEPQSSTQGSILPALSHYTTFSSTLLARPNHPAARAAHEQTLQFSARLLHHHTRAGGPFRPSLLRTHLTSSCLAHFPRNTIFLSLYAWTESLSRLRTDNRVRSLLATSILTPATDAPSSRLFAISHELQHGTIHAAKAAFEHALRAPGVSSSAGLWKLYLLFCLEREEFRASAKEVWYRCLRACPWAKELYLCGLEIDHIPGLDWEEKRGTWRVMGEKEVRVHVDLEDRFEEILGDAGGAQKRVASR